MHACMLPSAGRMRALCNLRRLRRGSLPWMNCSIRKELNKRYKLLLKAQQTPKGSEAWMDYKKARNHCTKLLRSAESNYWLSKFNEATSAKDF